MSCAECGRPIHEHTLIDARLCLVRLTNREPAYCRLIGPADHEAWLRAVAEQEARS